MGLNMGEQVVLRRHFQHVISYVLLTVLAVPLTLATVAMLVEKLWGRRDCPWGICSTRGLPPLRPDTSWRPS